jgi:hypothetical protein
LQTTKPEEKRTVIWSRSKFNSFGEKQRKITNPPRGSWEGSQWSNLGPFLLHPHHITCLKALWPLEQIEFHRFAFVQRAITILLDGGEMNENVLPGGALDEPVSLGPVEPLYCTLLSHKELLSPLLWFNFRTLRGARAPLQPPPRENESTAAEHHAHKKSSVGSAVAEATAQLCRSLSIGVILWLQDTKHLPQASILPAQKIRQWAEDNIQELHFWQAKKSEE